MKQILKEQIKSIINENEIFITITKTLKDEYGHDYNIFEYIELIEYIRNKDKYEKDFFSISYVDKSNFNEIQDIRLEIEEGLNDYLNALVEEHMKLYDIEEVQNYIKELLNI